MAIKSSGIKVGRYRIGKGIAGKAKKAGAGARKTYGDAARKQKKTGAKVRKTYASVASSQKKTGAGRPWLILSVAAAKSAPNIGTTTPPSSLIIRCISTYISRRFVSLSSDRASISNLLKRSLFQDESFQ